MGGGRKLRLWGDASRYTEDQTKGEKARIKPPQSCSNIQMSLYKLTGIISYIVTYATVVKNKPLATADERPKI
jgi:hypothetical protein